ncbi:MAG: phosphogluconate dehydratase [Gemmatimonadetes bacterium]|nr:phosphogluconate dehydratase [Gemmatimonadota bacterium]
MNKQVKAVTERIVGKSRASREAYLAHIERAKGAGPSRSSLSCGNLAHGFAACAPVEKKDLAGDVKSNIAIVSAYNDMLSAHQPYRDTPEQIKSAILEAGGVAQFAGGVPAMCDGVTQGQPGMELSLFSRDVIAMSTAIALSHNMFDGGLCLGICDKIVPGLLIGALSFGHLPFIFVPSGPMKSGLTNDKKAKVRQQYAAGEIGRAELLASESKAYHSPGTCTFYGTANSNQMLMEIMGLHLPGASFVNPGTDLRHALTREASQQVLRLTALGDDYRPIGRLMSEKTIVNGIVALLATGGSTNHTIHLVAIARAAGIRIDWDDFSALSDVVPLMTRIYPNGSADVNHFHAAGGTGVLIRSLLEGGYLHEDVETVFAGQGGLAAYCSEPVLRGNGELTWRDSPESSHDPAVLAPIDAPFADNGGLKLLTGNLGRAVIKTSAVKPELCTVTAPAVVLDHQDELAEKYHAGELPDDFIAVLRFQGPRANGMPELHKLTPLLGVFQDAGRKVALVTDGRMSGASGKVPAAIHVSPECVDGGPLAKVRSGDMIALDAGAGKLEALVPQEEWERRAPHTPDLHANESGMGRELFGGLRTNASSAEEGAVTFAHRLSMVEKMTMETT